MASPALKRDKQYVIGCYVAGLADAIRRTYVATTERGELVEVVQDSVQPNDAMRVVVRVANDRALVVDSARRQVTGAQGGSLFARSATQKVLPQLVRRLDLDRSFPKRWCISIR